MASADPIHDHVEKFLAGRPELRHQIQQQGEGEYLIDGRPVKVGFCRQGFLVVHDQSLRQPFTDYMEKKENTAVYHTKGLKNSALNSVPRDSRISFGDEGNRYSRLDAMKIAKEQALFREKAANYVNEGQFVPSDLKEKYQKTIEKKLGHRHRPQPQPVTTPEKLAPSWWPGAPTNQPAPATSSPTAQATQNPYAQMPNLLQIAAARNAARPATTKMPMPGMPHMCQAAPQLLGAAGYPQRPVIAGRMCGA